MRQRVLGWFGRFLLSQVTSLVAIGLFLPPVAAGPKVVARMGAHASKAGHAPGAGAVSADPDPDFDRLDGTGASGKKVHVIEWEGNLEIHVYPKGSLQGLAMKLDTRNQSKPVMVLGYRFDTEPGKVVVRRAVLGIPLGPTFHTYQDRSEADFDKVIATNHELGKPLLAFKLDPPPTQLYPEGHPALAEGDSGTPAGQQGRAPAQQPGARH